MADRNNDGSDKQPPEAVVPPESDADAILAALASQGMNLDAEGIQGLLRRTLEACPELAAGFTVVDDRPGAEKTLAAPVRLEAFRLMQEAVTTLKEIPNCLPWVQAPPDAHVLACEQGSWIMDPNTTEAWFNHHLALDGLAPLCEEEVASGLYPDNMVKQLLLAANQNGLAEAPPEVDLDAPDFLSDMLPVSREKVIAELKAMRLAYQQSQGDEHIQLPPQLRCPLSGAPFARPVTLSDGLTYEHDVVMRVLDAYAMQGIRRSPITGVRLQALFVDNLTIKAWVDGWDLGQSIRANVLAIPLKVYDLGVPELAVGDESERAPSP